MIDSEQPVVRAIILGNDALRAARPAAPLQLLNACARAGFDFVAPVSWGEELLAMQAGEWIRRHAPASAIPAHCPYVAQALRSTPPSDATCLAGVSPPVAAARYLRAVFAPRTLHVVFAGGCPGAGGPDIDEVVLPEALLARFGDARIVVTEEPPELDSRLPPERARYASLPGGAPAPGWLGAVAGAAALEVAPVTLAAAPRASNVSSVVLDLHVACACVCASNRDDVARLEPPRSAGPVVRSDPPVDLQRGALLAVVGADIGGWTVAGAEGDRAPAVVPGDSAEFAPADSRVAFAPRETGSAGAPHPGDAGLGRLTGVLEPWLEPPRSVRAPGGGDRVARSRTGS